MLIFYAETYSRVICFSVTSRRTKEKLRHFGGVYFSFHDSSYKGYAFNKNCFQTTFAYVNHLHRNT